MADLAAFTHEDFAPLRGSRFWLHPPDPAAPALPALPAMEQVEPIPLDLLEVTVGNQHGTRIPFSLVFRGPRGAQLRQRIYRLDHDSMGALEIFLVPIKPDTEGPRYEAVFN